MHFSIYTLSDEEIFSILFSFRSSQKRSTAYKLKLTAAVKEEEDHEQNFALPSRNRRRFSMRDFVYSHRTLIRRALQVKLPMLQVSVNPCCFTIFTTKENCIFFYGKMCADYHGGSGKKRLL